MPSCFRVLHASALLAALLLCLQPVRADALHTPRKVIERLGVEMRQILDRPEFGRSAEDVERAAADQITALIRTSAGHLSLTEQDFRGRTPLMLATSGGYALVVDALLADPSVRLGINAPDRYGETAWMLASFAPTATLVACQPGMLTQDRYWLLQPYLLRMGHKLRNKGVALARIVRALEAAGAERTQEAGKRAWLQRCPNTSAELRQALQEGDLMQTLLGHAAAKHAEYNRALHRNPKNIPLRPPEDMRFVEAAGAHPQPQPQPLLKTHELVCARTPPPHWAVRVRWTGDVLLKAVAMTSGGVVEVADVDVLSITGDPKPEVPDYFRRLVLQVLADYECEGEHRFEREFQFRIR
jgi:hypothetical protein